MDGRYYDPIKRLSVAPFTSPQRQRLEALTAAVGLLGAGRPLVELLRAARYIAGEVDR